MKIAELEHQSVREDLATAVEKAAADVETGAAALAEAESVLTTATQERDRVAALIGATQANLAAASEAMRAAKRASLEATASGSPDSRLDSAHARAAAQRAKLVDELAFLGTWPAEDAARGVLIAELALHAAKADQFECQASLCRLRMLLQAGNAFAQDPGSKIDISDAFSTRAMTEASKIRADLIPLLDVQIGRHDARVAQERDSISKTLGL